MRKKNFFSRNKSPLFRTFFYSYYNVLFENPASIYKIRVTPQYLADQFRSRYTFYKKKRKKTTLILHASIRIVLDGGRYEEK